MVEPVMNKYRATKFEKEYCAKTMTNYPVELSLRHGKEPITYLGQVHVLKETTEEIRGHKFSWVAIMMRTMKDLPEFFVIPLPSGMKLENVMTNKKFRETDHGYRVMNFLLIGLLILFDVVWMFTARSMVEIGPEAFLSAPFMFICGLIVSTGILAWIYNKTHYAHCLSLECFEPENENDKCHLCYPVDCDVPVHRTLWFAAVPELMKEAINRFSQDLDEVVVDAFGVIGNQNRKMNDIMSRRRDEQILNEDRATMMSVQRPAWLDGQAALLIIVGLVCVVAGVVFFAIGAK